MILEKFTFSVAFNLRKQNLTDFSFISLTQNFGLRLYQFVSLSISHHKGILNKHLGKNFFEENRKTVFLWRFEYRRRRLNSNKESHWL